MRKQLVISMGLALTLIVAVVLGRGLIFAQSVVEQRSPGLSDGSAVATRIALPALDVGDGWETAIRVQNAGSGDTRAVLELYPVSDGQCPTEGSVVGILCSGLIAPGTAWVWNTSDLPASAGSAIVYSVVPGTEDVACGGDGTRQPGQPIAVTVDRLREEAGVMPAAASAYAGVPQERAGTFDPTVNGFPYYVPLVTAAYEGQSSTLIVQNLGGECGSLELWYQSQGDCSQVTMDEVPALAPGEAVRVNAGDVLTAPFRGSAWIRADQPMAVVADRWAAEGSVLMTSRGVAQADSSLINYAPLVYKDFDDWNASLNVQNTSSNVNAKAKTYFLDSFDDIIFVIVNWVCPRGTRSYHLSEVDDLPGHYVGPARMESQEWWTPNDPTVFITNIVSSVDLMNEEMGQGVSYTGVTVPEGEETELVALPYLMKDETRSSRIAIYSPGPGSAAFQLEVYDQNGLLEVVSLGQHAGHVYMDLASWDSINTGFRGSGLVRVTSQGGGSGLGVVVVEYDDGSGGGDLSRGYAGIPISAAGDPPTPTPTVLPMGTPTSTPSPASTPTRAPTTTPTARPAPPGGFDRHIALPALGATQGWETEVVIQDLGSDFTKAALVMWGEPGQCAPQAAGPMGVGCTGLLKPGTSWRFTEIPETAKSGIVYSISSEADFADRLCDSLSSDVVGDDQAWRGFDQAFRAGGVWTAPDGTEFDFGQFVGQPPAVVVNRKRTTEGDVIPPVASAYTGISEEMEGSYDPTIGGFAYYVPLVYAEHPDPPESYTSWIHIQNLGNVCASVELWFQEQDDSQQSTACEIDDLAPGETYQYDASVCVGPGFVGAAWIRANQPLAVVVDQYAEMSNVLMTSRGVAQIPGSLVNYAPLVYREFEGWNASLNVQNISSIVNAQAGVYFMDTSGDVITNTEAWICPRGSQTYYLSEINELPGHYVGPARVESLGWSTGPPPTLRPNLVSSVDLVNEELGQGASYNALPAPQEGGVEFIGLPHLMRGTTRTSRIAIQNLNPNPGFTDFALALYDQNGLLDYVCMKLNAKQSEYIDLDTWGYINPGWVGSGVVRIDYSTQGFEPALGVVVLEPDDGSRGGDLSRAYAGIVLSAGEEGPPFPPCPGSSEPTATATSAATSTATPKATPSPTPTSTLSPTSTPTLTSILVPPLSIYLPVIVKSDQP